MNILAFDIETIPDTEGGRRVHKLGDLDDNSVAKAMFHLRQQKSGSEFLALHLHRIVAISAVYRGRGNEYKVWSLGSDNTGSDSAEGENTINEEATEAQILQAFHDLIDRYTPTLVTWNGSGFDLPVINYRTLKHGISAPRFWEQGEEDNSFRFNNYISRYHMRHTDLMDTLAMHQRPGVPLDELSVLLGFPGKMDMSGTQVWEQWQAGKLAEIRDYCETDALNTYLIYLRFQLMRDYLSATQYERECLLLRDYLTSAAKPHWLEFVENWRK
jgi:predicted PolB exonuclease-like 3'-5' exonuclease